jgi:amino acid transporter
MSDPPDAGPALRRSLSLPLVTLYGLGTTIGAGVYALTGEIAGLAGVYAPVAFVVASFMATFTALSFAELSSRFPRSAGEAVYVQEGLGRPRLAQGVGLLVALSGAVSAATITNGFVGYLGELVEVPRAFAILAMLVSLGLIAAWGIGQSVLLAGVLTLVEIGGLLLVIWVARDGFVELPPWVPALEPPDGGAWGGILGASILAFYAFLGFEDMVNVAEEVKNAGRVLPVAIVLTLVLTVLLYVAVASAAVLAVPPVELGRSGAPLALVYERSTGGSGTLITVISVVAMLNGALIQIIMASRVLYGLAAQGALPSSFARIHPRTRTPWTGTAVVTAIAAVLALGFPLAPLAEATSILILVIFALVNLALWRVQGDRPAPPEATTFPRFVPALGFLVSAGFLVFEAFRRLAH